MGRCGGYFGGCGPCGGNYFNNSYGNNGYGNGFNSNGARENNAFVNNNVNANCREVYYEKDSCFNSNNTACCANRECDSCNGYNNGCNSYGCNSGSCGGFGGCGPVCGPVGGCGPVGCGPVGDCGFNGGCSTGGCGPVFNNGPRRNYGRGINRGFGGAAPNARLQKNLGFRGNRKN